MSDDELEKAAKQLATSNTSLLITGTALALLVRINDKEGELKNKIKKIKNQ